MGGAKTCDAFGDYLKHDLIDMEKEVSRMWNSYEDCVRYYDDSMKNWLNKTEGTATENIFLNFHRKTKNEAIAKVLILKISHKLK